jgi:hypothetical protein
MYEFVIKDMFESSPELRMKGQWVFDNIMFVELTATGTKKSRGHDFRYFHIGKMTDKIISITKHRLLSDLQIVFLCQQTLKVLTEIELWSL